MTEFLIRHFVKNPEQTEDEKVRLAYGNLSSWTGIVCNIFLFVLKLVIGLVMNSVSIVSDAFNNLTDCLSCLITLLGYKMAAKPADREHPFGHGRMEYIVSFVMAVIIFIVGFELLRTSVVSLFSPSELAFSWPLFIILACSILVKLWMGHFNSALGKKLNNLAMQAAAQDSRNDVLTTSAALLGLVLSQFSALPFDAIAGVLVSIFILFSGLDIFRDIISTLLGKPASYELTMQIRSIILSHPEVMGVHDMLIHDYGPGKKFGSAHAEVDASMDFLKAHEIIDDAEREIYEKLHVSMTLHLDPVDLSDPRTAVYRQQVQNILKKLDPELSIHDFRCVFGQEHTNLVFDVLMPYGSRHSEEEIQKALDEGLKGSVPTLYTVVTFDHAFTNLSREEDDA